MGGAWGFAEYFLIYYSNGKNSTNLLIMQNTYRVSPSFMMEFISKLEEKIWNKFASYRNVQRYIARWHESYNFGENFVMVIKEDGRFDLSATLDNMSDDLIFKISLDLGIEIPGLIYAVPEIKGMLADKYEDVGNIFNKSMEKIKEDPATSIIMANSALEKLIKRICLEPNIDRCKDKTTLYQLTKHILNQFNFFPDKSLNSNIRNIGSGLLTVAQSIENIRSNHTEAHGTMDEIIKNPLYAMLLINSVSTIGLFLLNYYEKDFRPPAPGSFDDEILF